ncbi:poly-gamma-glutamate synthase PgsB [Candidatus Woesearchaeota archaeon]|nr:poly-gamma-glutamate synthase PgsB [Candidatus Woesearchaeota archaeon]
MILETVFFIGVLIFFTIIEIINQKKHDNLLDQIPLRIHVNGIRGKSTVSRLLGSILEEAGYKTWTKTTGSAARLIGPKRSERIINRRVANINEQLEVLNHLKKYEETPEAIVFECMAIKPSYQRICEEKILKSHIGVITNVRLDHTDVMGETLQEITNSLSQMIPTNGVLIIGDIKPKFVKIIRREARKKNTKVVLSMKYITVLNDKELKKFNFYMHKENLAIGLAFANELKISKKIALDGMVKSNIDPGALMVSSKSMHRKNVTYVNAHAINDRESIIMTYNMLKNDNIIGDKVTKVAVLYHRKDRPKRVEEMSNVVAKDINVDHAILIGHYQQMAKNKLVKAGYKKNKIHIIRKQTLPNLLKTISKVSKTKNIVAIGMVNIKGELVDKTLNYFF